MPFVLAVAGMLSACSDIYYDRRETVALGADDHIASNMVAQMIDPWPRYVGNKNLTFDGMRMQAAADRYRRDCVIPPYPIGTTVLAVQQQAVQASAAGCIAPNSTGLGAATGWTSSSNSTQTPAYAPSTPSTPSATASSR
jgi:hypothetical protein